MKIKRKENKLNFEKVLSNSKEKILKKKVRGCFSIFPDCKISFGKIYLGDYSLLDIFIEIQFSRQQVHFDSEKERFLQQSL